MNHQRRRKTREIPKSPFFTEANFMYIALVRVAEDTKVKPPISPCDV